MMGYTVDVSRFPSKEFQLMWLRAYIAAQRRFKKNSGHTSDQVRLHPFFSDDQLSL